MTDAPTPTAEGMFALGDLPLQSGEMLASARLAWKTYGTLSPARDNVIVYPTSYTATHHDQDWLITPGGILDPARWFIITPDMFGNGLSSSPSNTPDYPALVTAADNIHAQRRLLAEHFGIDHIACVYGFSMGAQQAYHWAALYPELVARAVVLCGSAKTSVHNQVFLRGLLSILEAAPEHIGLGRFSAVPSLALRAFARVYAGWCMSQDWYRAGLHLQTAHSLDEFLDREWEPGFTACDAANLYAQAKTWDAGDISANPLYNNDLPRALNAITARVLLMPGTTDLYFRVADNEAELPHLRHAALRPIESIWGHVAGSPGAIEDAHRFVRATVREWLDN
jgi:homoserine O-acetyltransferase